MLYTTLKNMKKTSKNRITSTKKQGLDREHKDITCAVRLPKTMYDNLCKAAKVEGSSLSDIIRDALVRKMEDVFDKQREKMLKEAEFEAQMRKYGSNSSDITF